MMEPESEVATEREEQDTAEAEKLAQWMYERLQELGIESETVCWKPFNRTRDAQKKGCVQFWVEAIVHYGNKMYSVSTLTNTEPPQWQIQVCLNRRLRIYETDDVDDTQIDLNRYKEPEAIFKKLVDIRNNT